MATAGRQRAIVNPAGKRRSASARRRVAGWTLATCAAAAPLAAAAASADEAGPWPVKVVIVTAYENGEDRGDAPGELQLWVEREGLDRRLDFPGGVRPLRANADRSVLAMTTGMGLANAAASTMALAMDPRFDFRRAYWLVAGVAGIDPQAGAVGDAVWVDYALNDMARSLDPREAPADWPYGVYAFRAAGPGRRPAQAMEYGPFARYAQVYPLDPGLTGWAFALTRDTALGASDDTRALARLWRGFPATQDGPQVRRGASVSSNHYWHGIAATRWARDWTRLHTDGRAQFVVSDMEDAGIAAAFARLGRTGQVDPRRLLVLRAASNYTRPPPGMDAFESAQRPHAGRGLPAYEAAYRVGSRVLHELQADWDRYADAVPEAR
ncbi:Purine nucleoside permease [Lysobacter sp. yr284]|uniref:purine-nucleoside phosphorylase n=1 Tax=Lysobacter sp. yr284 TaxID=1761791 RepID=UPI000896CE21|nr:purine nucleoside permease [Lysobacter sp. yr284]SDZ08705.1 Purine nucleoside permease [Lysobacter sp. yr284]